VTDKIHILLPVHNRREITRLFIECLKAQTFENYHLILVDDGSTDGTEEMVRGSISDLTVIKGQGNWWWAGSLQKGYEWLRKNNVPPTDFVLIINDDTQFENDFLEAATNFLTKRSRFLLLAQCYSRQSGQLIDAGVHADLKRLTFEQMPAPDQVNCLSTRGLFLRFSDFTEIGGFHPRLLPHYLSDYEFTLRARRKGMKLMTDPSVKLWLDERATGYHGLKREPLPNQLKKFFSAKSAMNPFAWSAFILLACPWQWKLINLLRVWVERLYYLAGLILTARRPKGRVG
jgi:GT2 family glycosyltransferase